MSGRPAARGSEAARSIRLAPRTSSIVAVSSARPSRRFLFWPGRRARIASPIVLATVAIPPTTQPHPLPIRPHAPRRRVRCAAQDTRGGEAQARSMIDAAKAVGRKLMVAYRIQYEPNNREAQRLARSGELGPLRLIDAINTQDMGDPAQWRLKRALAGGGSLPDIGLYCLNTARFVTGEEPVEVDAATWSTANDPRFREVEEAVSFRLRFPSGTITNCLTSYGAHELRRLKLIAPGGWAEIEDAFAYRGQRLRVARRAGEAESVDERKLEQKNQFALELDHMAECVQADLTPRTPGEEGLQDHLLMEAIYESARTGRPVALPPAKGLDVTRGPEPEQG